jgi:hypothetical protein
MFRKKGKDVSDMDTVDGGRSTDMTEGGSRRKSFRKSKSFQRIKGLVTGESRRKKRQEKVAAANAQIAEAAKESSTRSASGNGGGGGAPQSLMAPFGEDDFGDDESTILGVQVDDSSVITGTSQASKSKKYLRGSSKISSASGTPGILPTMSVDSSDGMNNGVIGTVQSTDILKIVLLLMDTKSRRFELLQLEFDSQKALVSDVLGQIPFSVTESALSEQTYVSICGVDSKEVASSELLSNFCSGNEVLVAMPAGATAKECVRLARPILSDDKVVSMVRKFHHCVYSVQWCITPNIVCRISHWHVLFAIFFGNPL